MSHQDKLFLLLCELLFKTKIIDIKANNVMIIRFFFYKTLCRSQNYITRKKFHLLSFHYATKNYLKNL